MAPKGMVLSGDFDPRGYPIWISEGAQRARSAAQADWQPITEPQGNPWQPMANAADSDPKVTAADTAATARADAASAAQPVTAAAPPVTAAAPPVTAGPRLQGTVTYFYPQKAFGFIKQDNGGEDLFVHKVDVQDGQGLLDGDRVTYEVFTDPLTRLTMAGRPKPKVKAAKVSGGTGGDKWGKEALIPPIDKGQGGKGKAESVPSQAGKGPLSEALTGTVVKMHASSSPTSFTVICRITLCTSRMSVAATCSTATRSPSSLSRAIQRWAR